MFTFYIVLEEAESWGPSKLTNIGYPVSVSNLPVKYPLASGKLIPTPNKEESVCTQLAEQQLSGVSMSTLPVGP